MWLSGVQAGLQAFRSLPKGPQTVFKPCGIIFLVGWGFFSFHCVCFYFIFIFVLIFIFNSFKLNSDRFSGSAPYVGQPNYWVIQRGGWRSRTPPVAGPGGPSGGPVAPLCSRGGRARRCPDPAAPVSSWCGERGEREGKGQKEEERREEVKTNSVPSPRLYVGRVLCVAVTGLGHLPRSPAMAEGVWYHHGPCRPFPPRFSAGTAVLGVGRRVPRGAELSWGADGRGSVCVQTWDRLQRRVKSVSLLPSCLHFIYALLAVVDRKPSSPVGKSPDPLNAIHGLSIPASSS